jgi:hypothetical protein
LAAGRLTAVGSLAQVGCAAAVVAMGVRQEKMVDVGRVKAVSLANVKDMVVTHAGSSIEDDVGTTGVKQVDVAVKRIGHIKAELPAANDIDLGIDLHFAPPC